MRHSFFLTLLLLASFGQIAAQEQANLEDTARKSNRAAIQAIESFYCVYQATTEYSFGKRIATGPTQHWQVGSSMREYTRDGNGYRDALIENGVVKAKFYDGSGEKNECTGVISQYEGNGMGIHDLHRHCLFRFIGGNEGTRSRQLVLFDDLLNTVEHKIISASEVMDQDRRAVKVVVEFKADHNSTYWFDTSRNFLIYREEVNYYNSTTKQQNRVVKEVQKFHHAGSGVYFPESIVVNHTVKDGKPYTKTYFNISNIRINKPIPISDMTLNFPPGSKVTNNITGKLAKVNSDGKLVDTSVDIPQPFPVSTSGAASAQPVEYEKTVEREPLLNRILPYLSLALLLSAASIFFYRRRMQRKSEQE